MKDQIVASCLLIAQQLMSTEIVLHATKDSSLTQQMEDVPNYQQIAPVSIKTETAAHALQASTSTKHSIV